jgi:hypothetical protein
VIDAQNMGTTPQRAPWWSWAILFALSVIAIEHLQGNACPALSSADPLGLLTAQPARP